MCFWNSHGVVYYICVYLNVSKLQTTQRKRNTREKTEKKQKKHMIESTCQNTLQIVVDARRLYYTLHTPPLINILYHLLIETLVHSVLVAHRIRSGTYLCECFSNLAELCFVVMVTRSFFPFTFVGRCVRFFPHFFLRHAYLSLPHFSMVKR